MTIQGLINKLEKAKKKYGPRTRVCVDLREIKSAIEAFEEHSHHEINCFDVETIRWEIDDDWELSDGSERQRTVVALS